MANPSGVSLAKSGSPRPSGAPRASPTAALLARGLRDSELDYLREGMRPMAPFRKAFATAREAGISPTRVATSGEYPGGKFPPVRVDVSGGRAHLSDGRHRYLAAREAGARAIRARVVEYGPRGAVKSDRVVVLPLR